MLRSSLRGCSVKKNFFFLISQNLQENPCVVVSFLIKLQARDLQLYLETDFDTDSVFL